MKKKSDFGIRLTFKDGQQKMVPDITLPILRGCLGTMSQLPQVQQALAYVEFEHYGSTYELELTEDQLCQLILSWFQQQ